MNRYFKVGDVPWFKLVARQEEAEEPPAEEEVTEEEALEETDGEISPDAPTEEVEGETPVPVEEEQEEPFPFDLMLDQQPDIEGAFMAVDSATGDMLAMVGGYDYRRSKFNRAEQALRQVGSAFKPIVFGTALEQGYTLSDILFDEPTLFLDPTLFHIDEQGEIRITASPDRKRRMKLGLIPKPKPYQPHNYYNRYSGQVTLRNAMARSLNIVSVKLLNAVGYDHVLEYADKMKIESEHLQPYPSLALGAMEMTLRDIVYAYATFSRNGVRYEPRFISLIMDEKGRVIEENPIKGEQTISPQNAFLVTRALRSVIEDPKGTAGRARKLKLNIAGKTGTTDDYTDAWFVGYTPKITAGSWVGRDLKHTLGRNRTGGNTALPIWTRFIEGIREDLPNEDFPMPEGLIKVPIDRLSGKKFTRDCDCDHKEIINEVFIKGTEPTEICYQDEKQKLDLPWYLQKRTFQFDNENGRVRPSWVMIDYRSQRRAVRFLESKKEKAKDEQIN